MACFQRVSPTHALALWHVGCGGLIRSLSSNKYVATNSAGDCVLADRADAHVWFFVSREAAAVAEKQAGPRCAVVLADAVGEDTRYLALHGDRPRAERDPAVVRVAFPEDPDKGAPQSHLCFRQVWQQKRLLSCRNTNGQTGAVLSLTSERGGRPELFEVEVGVSTIGTGIVDASVVKNGEFVSYAAAVTLAVLELSVRFRLRSVHGRVLQKPPDSAASRGDDDKPRLRVVSQDGPKTDEAESNDRDLVLEAARRGVVASQKHPTYSFWSAEDGSLLSVAPSNVELSRPLLSESVALLVPPCADDEGARLEGTILHIAPAGSGWGLVHIGTRPKGDDDEAVVMWLMAGMRGRLETRRHTGAWESFRLEIVQQSFHAAMRELPMSLMSDLYAEADAADRARVRAEIAAQVSASRESGSPYGSPAKSSSKTNASFDHAAALSALGESNERKAAPKIDPASSKSSRSGSSPTIVARNEAKSSLPRNAANRSGKRASKKKKKQAQSQKPQRVVDASPQPGVSKAGGGAEAASSKTDGSASAEAKAASSSSLSSSTSVSEPSGKPCAACGRPLVGSYTRAQGKEFHTQCFSCRMCRRPLFPGAGQFHERGGAPYCSSCYANHLAPKCARCNKPIVGTTTTAMDKTWHKECLTCTICRLPLTQTFWLYADKPNEPRCSRCVTGSEEPLPGVRYGGSGRRAVNLPNPLLGSGSNASSLGSASGTVPGRARLTTPVMSPARGRQ